MAGLAACLLPVLWLGILFSTKQQTGGQGRGLRAAWPALPFTNVLLLPAAAISLAPGLAAFLASAYASRASTPLCAVSAPAHSAHSHQQLHPPARASFLTIVPVNTPGAAANLQWAGPPLPLVWFLYLASFILQPLATKLNKATSDHPLQQRSCRHAAWRAAWGAARLGLLALPCAHGLLACCGSSTSVPAGVLSLLTLPCSAAAHSGSGEALAVLSNVHFCFLCSLVLAAFWGLYLVGVVVRAVR